MQRHLWRKRAYGVRTCGLSTADKAVVLSQTGISCVLRKKASVSCSSWKAVCERDMQYRSDNFNFGLMSA